MPGVPEHGVKEVPEVLEVRVSEDPEDGEREGQEGLADGDY